MDKDEKKNKPVKRGFWRRFFRFWLFTGIIFTGIILLLFLIMKLFFPPEYFKGLAINTVRKTFNRQLSVNEVHINLLKGVEFTDITLGPLDNTQVFPDSFPVQSASIDKILLKYNIKELFHRRVVINEIILDSPDIFVNMTIPAKRDSLEKEPPADTTKTPILPVSIALERFRLLNAKFRMETHDTLVTQTLYLSDLDVKLDDIFIPQGDVLANDSALTASLGLNIDDASFRFTQKVIDGDTMAVNGVIAMASKIKVTTLDTLDLDFSLLVKDIELRSTAIPDFPVVSFNYPVSVKTELNALVEQESISIPRLDIKVGDETWLGAVVDVKGFLKEIPPYISAEIRQSRIPTSQLLTIVQSVLPDSLIPQVYFRNPNAAITFAGTQVKGYVPDSLSSKGLDFLAKAEFLDFGLTLDQGQAELLNLNFKAQSSGSLNFYGLQDLKANASVTFDSVYYGLNDSIYVYTGLGSFRFETDLNKLLLPEKADLKIEIANVLGTTLNTSIALKSDNSLHSMYGSGNVQVTGIDSKIVPSLPLSTTAEMNVDLQIQSLDSIYTRLDFVTDSLIVPFQFENETFPPIRFTTRLLCSVDTLFQNIDIHNLNVKLNNLVSADISATIKEAGKKSFDLILKDLALQHAPLFDWMPRRMKEQYSGLDLSGSTHVTAAINGKTAGSQPIFDLTSRVFTENTSLKYPDQFITVAGIHLNVDADFNSENHTNVSVSINIDSLLTDNIRRTAFLNNAISLDINSQDLKNFKIENGKISLPELLANGEFFANINNVDTNPEIAAMLDFHQNAEKPLKIMRDMELVGSTEIQATVEMDTSILEAFATLKTKALSLQLPAETSVNNINADLKFHQKMDLVKGIFLADKEAPIKTPTDGSIDYLAYRDYYRNSLDDMSYLNIDKIKAGGFELDMFSLEAVLGGGRIEIPSYLGTVYEGNLGGRMSVNLAGGNLAEAKYNLSAHFSGINSDRLLPGLKRKETLGVINGNAQFNGIGLDPNETLDIRGYFYITEVGPRVADNLLRSLDPEEKDSGIKMTRFLINRGYKPQLFSFDVRHGFFTTTVELSQPWYFPIKLSGGQIVFARKPVQFFIDQALSVARAAQ